MQHAQCEEDHLQALSLYNQKQDLAHFCNMPIQAIQLLLTLDDSNWR